MKLYVLDKTGRRKLFLRTVASTRSQLTHILGGRHFTIEGQQYDVGEVIAEKGSDSTSLGMLVGGLIGAVGGVQGVAAGGFIGALLGKEQDKKEEVAVAEFNGSLA